MHQVHSEKIASGGGTVQVVLDFELKKAVYSELAKQTAYLLWNMHAEKSREQRKTD
jgi:hypothetical protein